MLLLSGGLLIAGVLLFKGRYSLGFAAFAIAALCDQWNQTAFALIRGTSKAHVESVTVGATYLGLAAVEVGVYELGHLTFTLAGALAVAFGLLRSALACILSGVEWNIRLREIVHALATRLRPAFPYLASDVLGLAYLRGDTLVLAGFASTKVVGMYVAAGMFVNPLIQVASSMSMGAIAVASKTSKDSSEAPERSITKYFAVIGLLVGSGICLIMTPLTEIVYGHLETSVTELGVILALFLPLRFLNFGLSSVLLAQGKAVTRLVIVVGSLVLNVALNVALDPFVGAFGAAWGTVITEVGVSILFAVSLRSGPSTRSVSIITAAVCVSSATLLLYYTKLSVEVIPLVTCATLGAAGAGLWVASGRKVNGET